jgi:hypothetical protein
MKCNDLTQHGDQELSLWVNNDELLHQAYQRSLNREDLRPLLEVLDMAGFTYTQEQWEVLEEEFQDELKELDVSSYSA